MPFNVLAPYGTRMAINWTDDKIPVYDFDQCDFSANAYEGVPGHGYDHDAYIITSTTKSHVIGHIYPYEAYIWGDHLLNNSEISGNDHSCAWDENDSTPGVIIKFRSTSGSLKFGVISGNDVDLTLQQGAIEALTGFNETPQEFRQIGQYNMPVYTVRRETSILCMNGLVLHDKVKPGTRIAVDTAGQFRRFIAGETVDTVPDAVRFDYIEYHGTEYTNLCVQDDQGHYWWPIIYDVPDGFNTKMDCQTGYIRTHLELGSMRDQLGIIVDGASTSLIIPQPPHTNDKPVCWINSDIAGKVYTGNSLTVSVGYSDDEAFSGSARIKLFMDGTSVYDQPLSTPDGSARAQNITLNISSLSRPATHTLKAQVTDVHGAVSEYNSRNTASFKYDNPATPPPPPPVDQAPTVWFNGCSYLGGDKVSFSIGFQDDGIFDGNSSIAVYLSDKRVALETLNLTTNKGVWSKTLTLDAVNFPDGVYTPKAQVTDRKGHQSDLKVADSNLTIKRTAPQTTTIPKCWFNTLTSVFNTPSIDLSITCQDDAVFSGNGAQIDLIITPKGQAVGDTPDFTRWIFGGTWNASIGAYLLVDTYTFDVGRYPPGNYVLTLFCSDTAWNQSVTATKEITLQFDSGSDSQNSRISWAVEPPDIISSSCEFRVSVNSEESLQNAQAYVKVNNYSYPGGFILDPLNNTKAIVWFVLNQECIDIGNRAQITVYVSGPTRCYTLSKTVTFAKDAPPEVTIQSFMTWNSRDEKSVGNPLQQPYTRGVTQLVISASDPHLNGGHFKVFIGPPNIGEAVFDAQYLVGQYDPLYVTSATWTWTAPSTSSIDGMRTIGVAVYDYFGNKTSLFANSVQFMGSSILPTTPTKPVITYVESFESADYICVDVTAVTPSSYLKTLEVFANGVSVGVQTVPAGTTSITLNLTFTKTVYGNNPINLLARATSLAPESFVTEFTRTYTIPVARPAPPPPPALTDTQVSLIIDRTSLYSDSLKAIISFTGNVSGLAKVVASDSLGIFVMNEYFTTPKTLVFNQASQFTVLGQTNILTVSVYDIYGNVFTRTADITLNAAVRYWVGNNGNWNDSAHWALATGGVGGASIPDNTSTVVIDDNSLTSGTAVVIPDGYQAKYRQIFVTVTGRTIADAIANGSGIQLDADPDFVPGNIRTGINIGGKAGTYDLESINPALPGDIKAGMVAFVNGSKVIGSLNDILSGATELSVTFKESINIKDPVYTYDVNTSWNNSVSGGTFDTTLGGTTYSVSLSPNCAYLAVGNYVTNEFLTVYKRNGTTWNKIPHTNFSGVTWTTYPQQAVAWSPDGTYLVTCGYWGSALITITIFKRSGDTFTKITTFTGPFPTYAPSVVKWSPDGNYFAVNEWYTNSGKYVYVYKRSGDSFTNLYKLDLTTIGQCYDISWSSDFLLFTTYGTPLINLYKRNGDTLTKLSPPLSLPGGGGGGTVTSCAFSPDGKMLLAASGTAPFLMAYSVMSDGTLIPVSTQPPQPTRVPKTIEWNPDSNYFMLGHAIPPFLDLYYLETDGSFTQLPTPSWVPVQGGGTSSEQYYCSLSARSDGAGSFYLAGACKIQTTYSTASTVYLTIAKAANVFVGSFAKKASIISFANLSVHGLTSIGYAKEPGVLNDVRKVYKLWHP